MSVIPEKLMLQKSDHGRMSWLDPSTGKPSLIEGAAAGYFRMQGFNVPYLMPSMRTRGGDSSFYWSILNSCLLAAMFDKYDHKNSLNREILDDICGWGVRVSGIGMMKVKSPFSGEMCELSHSKNHEEAISFAGMRLRDTIEKNLIMILPKCLSKHGLTRDLFGEELTPKEITRKAMILIDILGIDKIIGIQKFRALKFWRDANSRGWPDLMIWNSEELFFIEVKGPNDKISPDQKKVFEELESIGFKCKKLDVLKNRA